MSTERICAWQVTDQLPWGLAELMAFERFHLHKVARVQNMARDPSFDTRYLPQNCGAFPLPCFWIPRRSLHVYGCHADTGDQMSVFTSRERSEYVLFAVHPTAVDKYAEFFSQVGARDAARDGLLIWAVPTSSTRTLLVWPDGAPEKAVFIKTSLHSPLFGNRHVSAMKAGRSIGLSRMVLESKTDLPSILSYFPETCGVVPRLPPVSGMIVRCIPAEIKDGRILAAPLFSLLGGAGDRVPLLLTILERSGMSPLEFVDEVLCRPFARLWLEMTLHWGLMLEAHAQDLMLALSPQLMPLGRFYYRDFEGLQVDWDLRRHRGYPAAAHMPHDWAWHETYATLGYRFCAFTWYKWRISLFDYLHFVLRETELSLREWHDRGLCRGRKLEEDEVTMLFSRHMFEAIETMFGVRVQAHYNIYRSLYRFLNFLLGVRREVIGSARLPLP